jgi:hypothetical protein
VCVEDPLHLGREVRLRVDDVLPACHQILRTVERYSVFILGTACHSS